jgi:hypothetical protein
VVTDAERARDALSEFYPCIGGKCRPDWSCAPCKTRDRVVAALTAARLDELDKLAALQIEGLVAMNRALSAYHRLDGAIIDARRRLILEGEGA